MSARTHRHVMGEIARHGRVRCLGVDYRRSPEDLFPAAVEDTISTYTWLLQEGGHWLRILQYGDSPGSTVGRIKMTSRDRGVPLPAAGIAFSPWTDLAVTGPSADQADDPIVSGPALRSMAQAYLGGSDPTRWPFAAQHGDPGRGSPPLLIQVGTREALLDDSPLRHPGRPAGGDRRAG